MAAALEDRTRALGSELLHSARSHHAGFLSASLWSDKIMSWTMKDHDFKVQLFRFIDVFPRLRTPEQVHEYLTEYLSQPGVTLPPGLATGLKAGGLLKGGMTKIMTNRIRSMAGNFIAGATLDDACPVLHSLWKKGTGFSVDLLGEACVSTSEAEEYRNRYLELVRELPAIVAPWKDNPSLDHDHLGPIPRVNISIKISALYDQLNPLDTEGSIAALTDALAPILEAAGTHDVLVNFDMEQHAFKDLTLELFRHCCEQFDFPAGIVLQAYLRSGDEDARGMSAWARSSGRRITVRLVKGAYWDYETIHAEEMGWPVPVWQRKDETDACFERMSALLVESTPRSLDEGGTTLAMGTHNARSIARGLALLEQHDLPGTAIEVQMLHGMGAELKKAVMERGLRVREYVPVGEIIPGMAYLVRRLLENTSNESWLLASARRNPDENTLLQDPHGTETSTASPAIDASRHGLSPATVGIGSGQPFLNEPTRDFSSGTVRRRFLDVITTARVPDVPPVGDTGDADRALSAATEAWPRWRDTAPRARAAILVRAAEIMRSRRDELCGILIREAGKCWRDADAETCEAIDFCEYYARCAIPLLEPSRLGRFAGEHNACFHQPRGVCAVISPWNFPLAILGGMTCAALVTGNTVIAKPSNQTPGIGQEFCRILHEAGIPQDVLHFLHGPGSTVGAYLVEDPRTSIIAFTGSRDVGLRLIASSADTGETQDHVKRVICEMGGKNAIIIDDSADLDEAVPGVRQSAFGYQGQKCSACSRVIVLDSVYDEFVARLIESTKSLQIGDPLHPATDIGPVIDEKAADSIRRYIETGTADAVPALALNLPDSSTLATGRAYVPPHIFVDVAPDAVIATEEIFGPVLSVLRAGSFDDALSIANSSAYKLTGGVYSRRPSHLARSCHEFRVGNLYLNRGTTGALVGRQPFGGFGLSGVGSKAGGSEYLQQFMNSRCVTENTMRRGFSPEA